MHLRRPLSHLRHAPNAVLATGALALSAWQAQLSRQSPQAHWTVGLLVVAALSSAVVLGRRREAWSTRRWVGRHIRFLQAWRTQPPSEVVSVVAWTVLITGIVGWDLASFAVQSHSLPTLSYFIGHITRYRIGRGLLFAVWLGLGAYLVSGRRAQSPR